jgi:site-specific recombinase XerD
MPTLPVPRGGQPAVATDALQRAADYAAASKSTATRRAYQSDFNHFAAWCALSGETPLPASAGIVAAYLASLADAGLKASTITRRCAAIACAHRLAGCEPPTAAEPVKAVLRGIRRTIGAAVTGKAPATARAIQAMLRRIPDTPAGKRDRALLLIGFSAALRRSELVALNLADIETVPEGIIVHVRRGKTDQEGQGAAIAIPRGSKLKPVEALTAWLDARKSSIPVNLTPDVKAAMPLFISIAKGGRPGGRLSGRAVALIVKRWAGAAKLDPALFAGHSLRAGFVTSALEAGADTFKIMDVTRHKRVETLRIYDRRAKAFKNHAGKEFL